MYVLVHIRQYFTNISPQSRIFMNNECIDIYLRCIEQNYFKTRIFFVEIRRVKADKDKESSMCHETLL